MSEKKKKKKSNSLYKMNQGDQSLPEFIQHMVLVMWHHHSSPAGVSSSAFPITIHPVSNSLFPCMN